MSHPVRRGQRAVYLYCFARSGAAAGLDLRGIDDKGAIERLEAKGLAAVFSHVPVEELDPLTAEAALDGAWLVPRVCRHQQVIEAVMAQSPVLPVRFGAVFSSLEALAEFLSDQADTIAAFLDQLVDRQEWDVKMVLDVEQMSACLRVNDPILAERQRQLPEAPGTRYFQERRLRTDAHREARRRAREESQEIHEQLQAQAVKVRPLALRNPPGSGREMVFHDAVLLPVASVASVLARLREMSDRYAGQGLELEFSGPWPPYNFCPAFASPELPRGEEKVV